MDKSSVIDTNQINDKFINSVCKRIIEDKPVRRKLPLSGRLHIDRPLPFICVYRRHSKNNDHGTEKLVKGEASYLIVSSSNKIRSSVTSLLQNIIALMSKEYNAFLIIEVWTKRTKSIDANLQTGIAYPNIRLKILKEHFPTETIEALEKSFERIYVQRQQVSTDVVFEKKQWPDNMKPLISSSFAKEMNCFTIGLEIEPFYQHPVTGELFPLVLKKFHQGISRGIKQGVFQFSHHQTRLRPTTYQALGRRALVKAVWEVDQKLAEISNMYDFLLLVTPINIDQSWNKFKSSKFEKSPIFYYRPIPINPSALKSKLYSIPIEQIEDPTLANLFHEKQIEIERTLSMLRDRRTRNFFYGSMQLYGDIDDRLKATAINILKNTIPHPHDPSKSQYFNAHYFAQKAEEELNFYRKIKPDISSKVQVRDDITGLMVSKGNLLLGRKISIHESRVEALLQHEVGTHVLTYINGKVQPFQQLYNGLAGYDELQEGIAVLSEYLVGGLTNTRLRLLAGRVIAASHLIDGASFVETYRELNKKFDFTQKIAYTITARVYRGGGLTKDAVYLRGLIKILNYFSNGGELKPLLIGKISSEHVPIIKELLARNVLEPVTLLPRYLENPKAVEKLNTLKNGITVFDLINRS